MRNWIGYHRLLQETAQDAAWLFNVTPAASPVFGTYTKVKGSKWELFLCEIRLQLERRVVSKSTSLCRAGPGVKRTLEEARIFIARWFQSADSGSAVLRQPHEGKVKRTWRPFQTHLVTYIYILFSLLAGRPWRSLKSRAGLGMLSLRGHR